MTTTAITCRARGGGTFGALPITVKTAGTFAAGDVSVTGVLYISAISRAYGSLAGGSVLEISGEGFADEDGLVTTNFVSIGLPPAAPCRVLSATQTRIVCQTEPAGRVHAGALPELLNPLEVSVNGIYAQCRAPALCMPGCNSTAAAEQGSDKCCSFDVPDPSNTDPLPFIGDDQEYGADNCSFYYTAHATANVTAFTADVTAAGMLSINGTMLDMGGVYVVPMALDDVVRWINPYEDDPNVLEAVMLPDMWGEGGADTLGLRALTITDSNATHISATIPDDLMMGSYQIVVWNVSMGAAVMPVLPDPLLHVSAQMLSIEPSVLPSSGGMITITGTGFPEDRERVQLFGKGQRWTVTSSSATSITAYSQGSLVPDALTFSLSILHADPDGGWCSEQTSVRSRPLTATLDLSLLSAVAEISESDQVQHGAEAVLTLQMTAESQVSAEAYLTDSVVMVMVGLEEVSVEVAMVNETVATITIPQSTIAALPVSPEYGHPVYVMVGGNMTGGIRPVIHVPLIIESVAPELGMFTWVMTRSCLLWYGCLRVPPSWPACVHLRFGSAWNFG